MRLEAAVVVVGRLAKVFGAVAAEVGEECEVHTLGCLRERQVLIIEVYLQDWHCGAVNEDADAVACEALDGGREVFL
ncbi:MAG: hypothetical protein J6Y98_09290 [Bacteroidales bacterium]|nr:hypothetical protein [Bacteroidales bacterium]